MRVGLQANLLTQADHVFVGTELTSVLTDDAYIMSMDITVATNGLTAGEGPLTVLVAHSNYSDAQVGEWYGANANWDLGNKIVQEQGRRQCRIIGVIPGLASNESLLDGRKFRVKLGWQMFEGDTLQFGVFTEGQAANLTTGCELHINGTAYARVA